MLRDGGGLEGSGFARAVPPGGYAWWYLDAVSDDRQSALTLIAFVGCVFSPWYAWAGRADPLDHAAFNVALYRRRGSRWALTERGRGRVHRTRDELRIGGSALGFEGGALVAEIDEAGFPVPLPLRGRVRLFPAIRGRAGVLLAEEGDHRWWPLAPRARVEVAFDAPAVRWSGTGYLDCNWGAAPLERAFRAWTWSRAPLSDGAAVLYDLVPRHGPPRALVLAFDERGVAAPFDPPPARRLPGTAFGLSRTMRSEGGAALVRTLTDSHFYARSLVEARLRGEQVLAVHESLSLDRFDTRWARLLLPFRMRRAR